MNRDGNLDLVAGLITKKLSVQFGDGTGGFGTASFLGMSAADGIAAGDLDGDGYLDLAAANAGLDSVAVVLGDGRGAWTPLQFYPTPGIPHATVTADFNQDGQPDLATIANSANAVSLLFGTGSGLQPGGVQPVGKAPRAIAVADLNRDQKADLIVANEGEQTLSLLLGDGAGGFVAAAPISVSVPPWALAAADLDQDGYVDLAVASSMAQLEILFGDGIGGVKRRLTLILPWSSAFISPGDINGDGRLDLVLGSFNGAFITALLSDGSGGFVRGQSKQLGSPPRDARLVDLNRDGALDLILISVDDVRVLLGDGHGSFTDHYLLNVGYDTPIALQVADMNGDWKPDIVVIGLFLPDVRVLLGDGTGSFTSSKSFVIGGKLSTFFGSPGRSLAVADLDRDGLLDVAVPTIDPDRVVVLPNLSRR